MDMDTVTIILRGEQQYFVLHEVPVAHVKEVQSYLEDFCGYSVVTTLNQWQGCHLGAVTLNAFLEQKQKVFEAECDWWNRYSTPLVTWYRQMKCATEALKGLVTNEAVAI